ncbi:CDP-alcohol phosphatidyltransferase family protein [Methanoplanus endosymbiosus]|uniref:CDP-alcohol phosphatidyltransferase family protein n=1 Tax=Methanoplanus endosymbiosus TaxID=33865 RepID=A0A9E7TGS4_9EURY|nr:CDP-alcohol phosphatidyltransferase family protein [Methanoplanus endosymbiosus]UUX91647.1 CDP-alcohol phosphatidyltransferase family protein [Methanoplanus endosymbiosus]
MTLDSFRPKVKGIIEPVARFSVRIGLRPDTCTVIAFIASVIAGYAFYISAVFAGVIFVFLNAFFDAIDGAIAREMHTASLKGDFLDHVLDRYADIVMICGIFAGSLAPWTVGVFALTGVIMSSYLGTQAQAVGAGRFYGGILGRADRLVLTIAAGLIFMAFPGYIAGLNAFGWLMVIFGVLGHFTAIQRFIHVWNNI